MTIDKREIRLRVKARKSLLTDDERRNAAKAVFDVLERTAAFLVADRILMYHSLPDELSTLEFIEKWSDRKQFFLPRVNGVNLELLPYRRTNLRHGAFNIEEPEGDEIVAAELMELIVVPGVAFDRLGNRVGRGKGFYDRLLSETKALTVGVGYDFQLFDEVPAEPHDTPMDVIITESSHLVFHRR
ncbi:MAG: 5-formyltetrahydrofolate cyclo-ligase [Muribaculaceae bacterium]|nr:5-formyltetrahydrofolate cyclo-ligase [Muribaculaceae bacterium]MDE6461673.1 5-formyltetrahydrofolate cyclo-ligase [Muribaculaceae bacterium]